MGASQSCPECKSTEIKPSSFKNMVQTAIDDGYPKDPNNNRNSTFSKGFDLAYTALDVAYPAFEGQGQKCPDCPPCSSQNALVECPDTTTCQEKDCERMLVNRNSNMYKSVYQTGYNAGYSEGQNAADGDLQEQLTAANQATTDAIKAPATAQKVKDYLKTFKTSFNCSAIGSNWADCDSRNRQVKCCINEVISKGSGSSFDNAYNQCKDFVDGKDISMAFGQLGGKTNETAACLIQDASLDPKPFHYIWNTVGPPSKKYADYHPFKSCVAKQSEIDRFIKKSEYKNNPKAAIEAAMEWCTQKKSDLKNSDQYKGKPINTEDHCNQSYAGAPRCTWGVQTNTGENGNVKTGWYITGAD